MLVFEEDNDFYISIINLYIVEQQTEEHYWILDFTSKARIVFEGKIKIQLYSKI